MNFTDNYIEMCINNVNIQNLCRHTKGDWFWNGEKPYLYCKSGLGSSNPHDYKWLPTLEDLFGILNNQYPVGIFIIIKEFNVWLEDRTLRKAYKDLKDYFLDYIMEILYNKSWNKKEWEEINGS